MMRKHIAITKTHNYRAGPLSPPALKELFAKKASVQDSLTPEQFAIMKMVNDDYEGPSL